MTEPTKVAYIFPGQGSQRVGMGRDLYDNFESARAVFEEADNTLGFPLSRLCFEGPEDELRKTVNAQPALVTVSIACLRAIHEVGSGDALPPPAFVAGHSLGEYTALPVAGVLDFKHTVYLARERGRFMWEAGLKQAGSMAAIIGLDESSLTEVCQETNTWIANFNSPEQLVISGAKENLAQAMDSAKAKGALRVIPLPVSGAFHTPLMQPAVDGMSDIIAVLTLNKPEVPIVANTTAQPLTTAASIKEELLRQLCNGIQWQRSIEYMVNNGVSTFIEIGPGNVLAGLTRRINRDVKTLNIGDVDTIKDVVGEDLAGA
jgi:[acyl-carrier-protein] S-malonyltransferase